MWWNSVLIQPRNATLRALHRQRFVASVSNQLQAAAARRPLSGNSVHAPHLNEADLGLRVFNSLSKTKEPLSPRVPGRLGWYQCGPTVYDSAHIGERMQLICSHHFTR